MVAPAGQVARGVRLRKRSGLAVVLLMVSACVPPTASPSESGAASSASAASGPSGSPLPIATEYATWEGIDLPDPAPAVTVGGLPSDVVAFGNGYVAVGTINAACCADGDPSLNRGVAWTSPDGRAWELHDDIAAFQHASVWVLATDGSRLLAAGSFAAPVPGGQGVSVTAMWTSTDGQTWSRLSGEVPDLVATGGPGFIGFYRAWNRASGRRPPAFMYSRDGLAWSAAASAVTGSVTHLVAAPTGGALAAGMVDGSPRADGSVTSDAAVWQSAAGVAWVGPERVAMEATIESVAVGGPGLIAVISDTTQHSEDSPNAVWSSADGRTWAREAIGLSPAETPHAIYGSGTVLVLVGTTVVEDNSIVTIWISTDGTSWARVPDQAALEFSDPGRVIATPQGLLAIGSRTDPATLHQVPRVWLARR